jgi:hypothetical protein
MFIGHYAVGLASKKAAPKPSLGTYIMAVSFLDLLWPIFLITGVEHVSIIPNAASPFERLDFTDYPLSHSLLMTVVWASLFAGVYWMLRRDTRSAAWLWMCVASHWVLDYFTHRPDLPLMPGSSALVGLGLWNSAAATIAIEGAMFIAGIYLYLRATKAKDKTGTLAFWGLIGFVLLAYVSSLLGPAPPDVNTIGWFGLLGWLTVLWGYWINKHREAKGN